MTTQETVTVEPLTSDAFGPYGHVIAAAGAARTLNGGAARKWDRLVPPEIFEMPMNLGIISARPAGRLRVTGVERHRHTHQLFVPMSPRPYVVVVAGPDPRRIRAFASDGSQGVCFAPGTWHHPLLPTEDEVPFLTMMRDSPEPDFEWRDLPHPHTLRLKERP